MAAPPRVLRLMLDLGEPVLDLILAVDPVKDVFEGINMPVVIGELDAVIRCPAGACLQTPRGGQNNVEPVRHGSDQVAQGGCCGHFPAFWCSSTKANFEVRSMATKS